MRDYIALAVRTENKDLDSCVVRMASCGYTLELLLWRFKELTEIIDRYKKYIYYGKDREGVSHKSAPEKNYDMRLLHGFLGLITEVGELEIERLDRKELGDIFWYLALLCSVKGWTFEEIMEENIVKLRKRYPEKFDSELAKGHNGE